LPPLSEHKQVFKFLHYIIVNYAAYTAWYAKAMHMIHRDENDTNNMCTLHE